MREYRARRLVSQIRFEVINLLEAEDACTFDPQGRPLPGGMLSAERATALVNSLTTVTGPPSRVPRL